jgi:RHS repeat-associated protein
MNYIYTDYLGSINTVYNQTSNAIIVDRNYDAWGRERDAVTLNYISSTTPEWLSRGFEGHEMLTDFALINMNGRVYDPVIGQFISADPVLQDENNCLNYNKYCFAFNNPLKYIDPSGCVTLEQSGYGGGETHVNDIDVTGSWWDRLKSAVSDFFAEQDGSDNDYMAAVGGVGVDSDGFIVDKDGKRITKALNEVEIVDKKKEKDYSTLNDVTNAGGVAIGVAENAATRTFIDNIKTSSFSSTKTWVKASNTLGKVGLVFNVAGNFCSAFKTYETGIVKGSDMIGYLGTGVAVLGMAFGGLAAAPALAIVGVGLGLTQIIAGDALDNNFSFKAFDR